ncbi:MAG TPA: hypothetical protein PJ982_00565 [Lacipirellulaceae bacterium]|nr:hypothetical protein [Lacipirellulaceae bacterium]
MKQTTMMFTCLAAACGAWTAAAARAADPWADQVISYAPGEGISNDFYSGQPFSNPLVALGEPTRFTSPSDFGSVVTPLNSPFRADEVVSIGRGGHLTVRFDEPIVDHPLNPFGIDLLIFGNAFFTGSFFNPDFSFNPAGVADGVDSEGGLIEVSADGVTFLPVPGEADGLFPTNAYADIVDPFTSTPGLVPADFTRPVDPSFNPVGKTFAEIVAGYNGSGGGVGIDISVTGLSSISYVRISTPIGAAFIPEIDAFAAVASIPEPATLILSMGAALILLGKTARGANVKRATRSSPSASPNVASAG